MLVATQNSFALNGGLSGHKGDEHHLTHHHVVGEEEQQHSLGEEHHHHQQQLLDEHHSLIHGNDDDDSSQGHDHGGLGGNVLEGTNVLPPIAEVEALGKQIGTRDLASHMYTSMVWCISQVNHPSLFFFVSNYFYHQVTPAHPILAPMYTHLPLNPSATMDEMPLYVNAKQYNRILKRRQARAKLESENIILPRKVGSSRFF